MKPNSSQGKENMYITLLPAHQFPLLTAAKERQ
jgi:hypothetical protein